MKRLNLVDGWFFMAIRFDDSKLFHAKPPILHRSLLSQHKACLISY